MICNQLKPTQRQTVIYYSFIIPRINDDYENLTNIVAFKHRLKRIEYFCDCKIHYDQLDNNFLTEINRSFHIFEIYYQLNKPTKHSGCLKMLHELFDKYNSIIPIVSLSLTKNNEIIRNFFLKDRLAFNYVVQSFQRTIMKDRASRKSSVFRPKSIMADESVMLDRILEVSITNDDDLNHKNIDFNCNDEWIDQIKRLMNKTSFSTTSKTLSSNVTVPAITNYSQFRWSSSEINDHSSENSFVSCISTLPYGDTSSGESFSDLTDGKSDSSSRSSKSSIPNCFQLLQSTPVKIAIFNVIDQLASEIFLRNYEQHKNNLSNKHHILIHQLTKNFIDEFIICYLLDHIRANSLYYNMLNNEPKTFLLMPNQSFKFHSSSNLSKIFLNSDIVKQTNCSNSQSTTLQNETLTLDRNSDMIKKINESLMPFLNLPNHVVSTDKRHKRNSKHEDNSESINISRFMEYFNIKLTTEVIEPNLRLYFLLVFSKWHLTNQVEQILFNDSMNTLYNTIIILEQSIDKLSELFYKKLIVDTKYRIITKNCQLHIAIETKENAHKHLVRFCANYIRNMRNAVLTVESMAGKKLHKSSQPIQKLSTINFGQRQLIHKSKAFKTIRYKQNCKFKIIDLLKVTHEFLTEEVQCALEVHIQMILNEPYFGMNRKFILNKILAYTHLQFNKVTLVSTLHYYVYFMSFVYSSMNNITSSHTNLTLFKIHAYENSYLAKNISLNELICNLTNHRDLPEFTDYLRRIFCLYCPIGLFCASNSDTNNDVESFYSAHSTENDPIIMGYGIEQPPQINGDVTDIVVHCQHYYGVNNHNENLSILLQFI